MERSHDAAVAAAASDTVPTSTSHQPAAGSGAADNDDEFEFTSMAQVFEYARLTQTQLDDKELRVIAAGISYRAAWRGIMEFERLPRPLSSCRPEAVKFVQLLPNQPPTLKSRVLAALGQTPEAFDRHDYIVDRCGTRLRYTIEFLPGLSETEFTVDARPCFNAGRGWVDRFVRRPLWLTWQRAFGVQK